MIYCSVNQQPAGRALLVRTMSCVTLINFRLLLPNWLRSKKRERRTFDDESENYIDLYWSFQPDYEHAPEEERETRENIYDDVPLESQQSLPSTLERTAMFEDIHSFLRSGHQSGEQEASESSCEENTGSSQLSGTMVGRDEVEQLFQNYIFQDSSFDRRRLSSERQRRLLTEQC